MTEEYVNPFVLTKDQAEFILKKEKEVSSRKLSYLAYIEFPELDILPNNESEAELLIEAAKLCLK